MTMIGAGGSQQKVSRWTLSKLYCKTTDFRGNVPINGDDVLVFSVAPSQPNGQIISFRSESEGGKGW